MATCLELYGYAPEWDTGFCSHCGKELTEEERTKAIHGTVHYGWNMYMHQWCFDYQHPIFITAVEAKIKWYDTHPELWEDLNDGSS